MGLSKAFRTDPIRALVSGITNRESGLCPIDVLCLLVDDLYQIEDIIHPALSKMNKGWPKGMYCPLLRDENDDISMTVHDKERSEKQGGMARLKGRLTLRHPLSCEAPTTVDR